MEVISDPNQVLAQKLYHVRISAFCVLIAFYNLLIVLVARTKIHLIALPLIDYLFQG